MLVPSVEIEQFNAWVNMQIALLQDCPPEAKRIQSVLYAIPFTVQIYHTDYAKAVEAAKIAPNVPLSVYSAFKQYRFW